MRFGGEIPKQFRSIKGRPLLSWTVSRFEHASSIDNIIVVAPEEYLLHIGDHIVDPFGFIKISKIVVGGKSRSESVFNGLQSLPISTSFVAIHDGARPLVRPEDIDRVTEIARTDRAAILGHPATDTIKRVQDDYIIATLDRGHLFCAETPQTFQYDLIMEAYKKACDVGLDKFTDDASIVEASGFKVKTVSSTGPNIKVTTPEDLRLVEAFLEDE